MGLILKSKKFNIKIDNNTLIGVMGEKYDSFINSLDGNNVVYIGKIDCFYTDSVIEEINLYENDSLIINSYLEKLCLDNGFLDKKISELSSGYKHLLRYLIGFIKKKKIIVIDEPFLDLDYYYKKRICFVLREMVNDKYTILIGSNNSDIIYSMAKKVLLINDNNYYYGDIRNVFINNNILSLYHIKKPLIVSFIDLVKEKKNISLEYSFDIRDLIKDVYKNV